MSYAYQYPVAVAQPSDRALFIRRTYAHLAAAILAFTALETVLVMVTPPEVIGTMIGTRMGWFMVMLAFMGASWLAQTWAHSETSPAVQYAGLGLYVIAEAVIFLPLLYIAAHFCGEEVIPTAGILTLAVFGGLSLSVFVTRKDYSFLAPVLCVGSFLALGVIIAGWIFQFPLGLFFAFAMVALLCGYVLYNTSNVMLHYRTDQHVAAALALFSSIATLFYYVLYIVMMLNGGGRRNN